MAKKKKKNGVLTKLLRLITPPLPGGMSKTQLKAFRAEVRSRKEVISSDRFEKKGGPSKIEKKIGKFARKTGRKIGRKIVKTVKKAVKKFKNRKKRK